MLNLKCDLLSQLKTNVKKLRIDIEVFIDIFMLMVLVMVRSMTRF